MGLIQHHAIVVTASHVRIEDARAAAEVAGLSVSGLSPLTVNGYRSYRSFAVFPDGSKEGWGESEEGDAARAKFVAWLEAKRYEDGSSPYGWAEVSFGELGVHLHSTSVSNARLCGGSAEPEATMREMAKRDIRAGQVVTAADVRPLTPYESAIDRLLPFVGEWDHETVDRFERETGDLELAEAIRADIRKGYVAPVSKALPALLRAFGLVAVSDGLAERLRTTRAKDDGCVHAPDMEGGHVTDYGEACDELATTALDQLGAKP